MKWIKNGLCVFISVVLAVTCLMPVFAEDAEPETEIETEAETEPETEPCVHVWEWVTDKEPTCLPGEKHMRCSLCGDEDFWRTQIAPVREHVWTAEYAEPYRCKDGYSRSVCTVCLSTKDETVLPATEAHSWVWVEDMPATRYDYGVKHQVCTVCGAVQNMNTAIPASCAACATL